MGGKRPHSGRTCPAFAAAEMHRIAASRDGGTNQRNPHPRAAFITVVGY
jgi:hypothetical protein